MASNQPIDIKFDVYVGIRGELENYRHGRPSKYQKQKLEICRLHYIRINLVFR